MNLPQELTVVAPGLAVLALVNWLLADRSFRGKELLIRRSSFWAGCRWFGLGLWIASMLATSPKDPLLEIAGLVGALILLLGTARTSHKDSTQLRPRAVRSQG
jgi:hypothetical protein